MNWTAAVTHGPAAHRIAVALLASLWQGVVIASAHAAARSLLPRSRARARYALGCAALALLVLWPVSTLWRAGETSFPGAWRIATAASASLSQPPERPVLAAKPGLGIATLRQAASAAEPWLVVVWLAGVVLLSLRLAMGWGAIEQLRHRWTSPAPGAVAESLRDIAGRLKLSRPVRVVTSAAVRVPTALGLFRPVILMPLASLSGFSPREIEAMLAHELAHIRRHDYLVNLMQSLAETLLFYHPAVWWIGRTVRAERENCCDDLAVAATGSARHYARALLHLEEVRSAPVQFALAADGASLSRRIVRLLSDREDHFRAPRVGACLLGAAALLILLGAGRKISVPLQDFGGPPELISLSSLSIPSPASAPVPSPDVPARAATSAAPRIPAAPPASANSPEPAVAAEPAPEAGSQAPALPRTAEMPAPEQETAVPAQPPVPARLPKERLEEMRRYGVTPEFVRGFIELGYERTTPDLLLSLRTHGVDASYVRELNGLFGERLPLETCLALRAHGVGASYAREMTSFLGKISPGEVQSLRVHGVTADGLRRFQDAGYRLSTDEAIAMRSHGVDPDMARDLMSLGFPRPSLEELRAARDHGVDAAFLRGMREAGLAGRSLDRMIELRNHGVTPEYVQSLQGLGYTSLDIDGALALRNHGVTPDFVKDFQELGYASLSIDQLLALRSHGVAPDFARGLQSAGYRNLSVDELLSLRNHGVTAEFARKAAGSGGHPSVDELIERKNSGREATR
jgi:beta-lactamase regulating signal transducer with metallopeptidase domain